MDCEASRWLERLSLHGLTLFGSFLKARRISSTCKRLEPQLSSIIVVVFFFPEGNNKRLTLQFDNTVDNRNDKTYSHTQMAILLDIKHVLLLGHRTKTSKSLRRSPCSKHKTGSLKEKARWPSVADVWWR